VKPGTYTIKAQDKSGNESVGYTSVVVPAAALETFATTLTLDENGTFGGSPDSDISVLTAALVIADTSVEPSEGSYMMEDYLDAGSVLRFRSRIDVTTARQDAGSGLWDDIPGVFDSIPGLFDDWTGAVQFADTDVRTFISLTDDNPAGTPTWGAWQEFKAGDFYARAARYMVTLKSTSPNVTPRVSRLTAILEHD
jgi:hypothetical protein